MTSEYGRRLRESRKHAQLTQEKLSAKTGIPQTTISTAERDGLGSADTSIYAKACGVNAHWLATGEGEMLQSVVAYSQIEGPSPPVFALQQALEGLDSTGRERAGVLLGRMAHDPAGPWAGWLVELLSEPESTSAGSPEERPD